MTTLPTLAILLLFTTAALAAPPATRPVLDVWPATAPGEKGDIGPEHVADAKGNIQRLANVSRPTLTLYKPDPAIDTGAAILICPGGGYTILAMDLEGEEVARWANSVGVTGIVLKYRVPARKGQPRHLAPSQDAQRAMRLVRANATAWGIDPTRVGILGFSAGGHLAAVTSAAPAARVYDPIDDADKLDARPNFTVLVYPAYLLAKDGSITPEVPIDAATPPAFLAHAADDGISADNSIAYFRALRAHKTPAELHVYSRGGHGFGLRPTTAPATAWPDRCAQWLKAMNLLERK